MAMLVVVALTPLVVDFLGRDVFRVPKRLFFQSAMLIIGAAMAAGALLWDEVARTLILNRRAVLFASAALVWTVIVDDGRRSGGEPRGGALRFLSCAAVRDRGRARTLGVRRRADRTAAAAVVNAVLVLLQGSTSGSRSSSTIRANSAWATSV
jgi:hypothetical protein